MKRISLTIFTILLMFQAWGQQKNETIDIITDASQMVLPDILQINIDLEYKDKKEQDALNRLSAGLDNQIQSIEKSGFKRENIKLYEFSINEETDWESNKSKKIGYKAIQSIKISIPITDKEMISKLIENITINKNENISVKISGELSDELNKKIQNELIKKVIIDATEKAHIMAESLNAKLGRVKSVEYGDLLFRPRMIRNAIRFVPPVISENNAQLRSTNTYQLLGISETEIAQKIRVIWYIE
jgi:uncharacterized protein